MLAGDSRPRGLAYKPEGLTSAQLNCPLRGDAAARGDVFAISSPRRRCSTRSASPLAQGRGGRGSGITARGARSAHGAGRRAPLDGSVHSETREAPRGSEHSFAPAEDIVDKFRSFTRARCPNASKDALVNAMLKLETLADSKRARPPAAGRGVVELM